MRTKLLYFLGLVWLLPFCLSSCTQKSKIAESEDVLINKDWEFTIDSLGYSSLEDFLNKKDFAWQKVTIPHTPRLEPKIVNDQWIGNCWYHKTISAAPRWKNKQLFMRFEGAMNVATVWVNGKEKITHYGGYLPFVIDVSKEMKEKGTIDVYVKLNNEHSLITGPKPLQELDFNMYGGIYRDVFLLVKSKVYISDEQYAQNKAGGGVFISYPKVTKEYAEVMIKTSVVNASEENQPLTVIQQLESDGNIISESRKQVNLEADTYADVEISLDVDNPELWTPQTPKLYKLTTKVTDGKNIFENQERRVGIRKFSFVDNKLYLNGKRIILRGVNRHQEYPYIGYALSNNANYRDAYKIKNAGFDYVRLSHYPHSKAFMEACDELGLVVVDAILGWQYYRDYEPFKKHVIQTCRDLVRRDRNYSCVLAWEVSLNESWMPEEFIDSLISATKEEYSTDDCFTAGWQKYGYDVYLQARQHRIDHEPNYPDKPYVVSEYGDWEYYAMNAGFSQDDWGDLLNEERTSRQKLGSGEKRLLQQSKNLQEAHNDNFNTPAVADGYWVMYDYNRGYANDLETSGIMSLFRLPKFSYFFYQSQRNAYEPVIGEKNKPMVFIANYAMENSDEEIRVFSNCDSVELFVNEKSLGIHQPDTGRIANNLNHPPFTFERSNTKVKSLNAKGYIGGEFVASYLVTTPGKASKIILEADISGKEIQAGCNDAVFVYAKVVDEKNQLVYNYSSDITLEVIGAAKGVGDLKVSPEAGIGAFLIVAGEQPGIITLKANSESIASDILKITTTL